MSPQAALAAEGARYQRPARLPRAAEAPAPSEAAAPKATSPLLLALFLFVLLLPLNFSLGGLSLTPIRVMLLLAFVPLLVRWLSGAAGRVTTGDVLIALHCLWVALALIVLHGTERIPYAGITVIEIFGSYLLGRLLVRNATDYRLFFRNFLVALVILAPFVAVEMVTSKLVLSQILDKLADTHPKLQTERRQDAHGLLPRPGGARAPDPLGGVLLDGDRQRLLHPPGEVLPERRAHRLRDRHDLHQPVLGAAPRRGGPDRHHRLGLDHPQRLVGADRPGGARLRGGRPHLEPHARAGADHLSHLQLGIGLLAAAHLHLRQRRGLAPPALRHRAERLGSAPTGWAPPRSTTSGS